MNRKMRREIKHQAISKTKAVLAGVLTLNTLGTIFAVSMPKKVAKELKAEAIANAVGKKTAKLEDVSIALDQELNDNGDGTYDITLKTSSNLTYEDLCVKETKVKYGYFKAERAGKYMLEIFGGNGGKGESTIYSRGGEGGKGGHIYAIAELDVGDILFYTIGGNGQKAFTNDTGGGANGDGGDHGDVGNYYVGGGGGYTALYKFSGTEDIKHFKSSYLNDDETLKRTDVLPDDRTSKYIMIAGGGGGGGAGNAFSLIDKAVRTPDGGEAGNVESPHGQLIGANYKVEGTFYSGHNGYSSGKVQDFIGKGGTEKPGEVNSTYLEWFAGKKPNDWEGTNNAKYPGGSGGAGNLRGGAGGAGFAGGSGGIMSGLMVGTNVGGGGGGSSFIAKSLISPTIEERDEYVTGTNLSSAGGSVYITYMPTYNDFSYLDNLKFDGEISKYFEIIEGSGVNKDGTSVEVDIDADKRNFTASNIKASPSTQATEQGNFSIVNLKVKPVDGFMGGNDVPLFNEDNKVLTYTYTRQAVSNTTLMELVKKCSYANVPYGFNLNTHNYTKSGSADEPNTDLTTSDLYDDMGYVEAKANSSTAYLFDFIKSVDDYSISQGSTSYSKGQQLSISETTSFDISFSVTPYGGNKAVVGQKLENKTFSSTAKVTIVPISKDTLNGEQMTYQRTLNYNPSDGSYDLTLTTSAAIKAFVPLEVQAETTSYNYTGGSSGTYTVPEDGLYFVQLWGGKGGHGGGNGLYSGGQSGTPGYVGQLINLSKDDVVHYVIGKNGNNGNSGGVARRGDTGDSGLGTYISVNGTANSNVVLGAGGSGGGGGGLWTGPAGSNSTNVTNTESAFDTGTFNVTNLNGENKNGSDWFSTDTSAAKSGKNYKNASYYSNHPAGGEFDTSRFLQTDYTIVDSSNSGGAFHITHFAAPTTMIGDYSVTANFTDDFVLQNASVAGATGIVNGNKVTDIDPSFTIQQDGNAVFTFSVTYNLLPAETCLGGVDIKLLDSLLLEQEDKDGNGDNDSIVVKSSGIDNPDDYATDFANVRIKQELLDGFSLSTTNTDYIQGDTAIATSTLYDAQTSFVGNGNLVVKEASEGLSETVSPNQTTDYSITYGIKLDHEAQKAEVGPTLEPLLITKTSRVNVYHVVDYDLNGINVDCSTSMVNGVEEKTFTPGQDYIATFTPAVGMELPDEIEVLINGVPSVTAQFEEKNADERVLTISGSELKNDSEVKISGEAKEKTFELHYLVALDATGLVTEDHVVELKAGLGDPYFTEELEKLLASYPGEGKEIPQFTGYVYVIEYPGDEPLTEMPAHDVWINGCYHPNPHSLTIHYVDKNGVELDDAYVDSSESCYFKKDIDVVSKNIEGYAPTEVHVGSYDGSDAGYNPARVQFVMPDEDLELYVVYEKIEHSVIINYQCKDPNVDLPEPKTITGVDGTIGTFIPKTISGYEADPASITYEITASGSSYLVTYSPIVHNISFNLDIPTTDPDYIALQPRTAFYGHEIGYTGESYEESTYLPLPEPVRTGYTFLGWYSNGFYVDGSTIFDSNSDIELKAMWKKTITNVTEDNSYIALSQDTFAYDGTEKKPTVSVIVNSTPLTLGEDYELTYPKDMINSGTKQITIKFKGDYGGELTKTYEITPRNMTSGELTVEDISGNSYIYTGDEIKPTPSVTFTLGEKVVNLVENKDFVYQYDDNVEQGNTAVVIHFIGNYANTPDKEAPFTILGRDISQDGTILVSGIEAQVKYTGSPIEPEVVVSLKDDNGTRALTEGYDYTVVYGKNTDVGEGTVTIRFINNYEKTPDEVRTFEILPLSFDKTKLSSDGIEEETFTYTGKPIEPTEFTISYDGVELQEGTDYIISYRDNTHINGDSNEPTVVIEFIGNYEGNDDYEIPFNIIPKAVPTPTDPEQEGGEKFTMDPIASKDNPIIVHQDGSGVPNLMPIYITDNESGEELELYEDFIIVIDDLEKGEAHIEFINDFEGTDDVEIFFKVVSPEVTSTIEPQDYTGDQIKPEVAVTFNGQPLTEGTDYIVTYGPNNEVGEGKGTIQIEYIGDYADISPKTVDLTFDITQANINAGDLVISEIPAQPYTGTQITPSFTVTYKGVTLTTADYEVAYGENIHAGEGAGKVVVTLKGGFASTSKKTIYFDILPKDADGPDGESNPFTITPDLSGNPITRPDTGSNPNLLPITIKDNETGKELRYPEDFTIEFDEEGNAEIVFHGDYATSDPIEVPYEVIEVKVASIDDDKQYTGTEITPKPKVTYGDRELQEGTDYVYHYENNEETGEGTIIVEFIGEFKDVPEKTVTFNIVQTTINEELLEISSIDPVTYNGKQQKPTPTVTYNGVALVEYTDFVYSYGENIHAGEDAGVVYINFIKGFKCDDETKVTFTILPKDADGDDGESNPFTITPDLSEEPITRPDTGSNPNLMPIVIKDNETGKELRNPEDFTIEFDEEGNAEIVFHGDYETSDPIEVPYELVEIQVATVEDQKYTTDEIKPEPTITYGEKTLLEGTDFVYVYKDNVEAGEGTIVIEFIGDFKDVPSKTVTFKIIPSEIDTELLEIGDIEPVTYNGNQQKPKPTVTYNGKVLVEYRDFVYSYGENVHAGEDAGIVYIEFIKGFTSEEETKATFTILPKVTDKDNLTITPSSENPDNPIQFNEDGEIPFDPDFEIIDEETGEPLVKGEDYDVIVNEEEGTIEIVFKGDREGTETIIEYFEKIPGDVSEKITYDPIDDQPYDPNGNTPEPSIYLNGEKLIEGEDYEVEYGTNEDGEPEAIIHFKDNYSETPDIHIPFEVTPKDLEEAVITFEADSVPYNGEPVAPVITVKDGDKVLEEGVDYIVRYIDNNQPGVGKALVEFIGNYAATETKTAEFGIKGTRLDNSTSNADGRSSVVVIYDEGFDPDITLTAELKEEVPNEIKNQAKLGGRFFGTFGDYEIKLLDKDGNEVQPSDIKEGTVLTLMIELPSELEGRDVKLIHYHSADDISVIVLGEEAGIGTYIITEEGYIVTQIDKFSSFSLIYEETCVAHWFLLTAAILNILLIASIIVMGKKQSKAFGIAAIVALTVITCVSAVFAHCTFCYVMLGINGLLVLFDVLFFIMWKGKEEPAQVAQQPQVVYVQAPAQAAPAPVAAPAPAPVVEEAPAPVEAELTLHESMEKAAAIVAELKVNKEVVASYLTEAYKDSVIVNRKPNYTKTGLPLADTHYVKLEKNVCVMYVYELNDGKSFLIVKTSEEIYKEIKAKHALTSVSLFPHTNDGGKWFTVMFDESYKTLEDVYEVIDMVIKGYAAPTPVVKPAEPVKEEPVKVAPVTDGLNLSKEIIANYLMENYSDTVTINRKENYTSTGLPLADTHYIKLLNGKDTCFLYVYEVDSGDVFFIVKTTEAVYEKLHAVHPMLVPSNFPRANETGAWYSLIFDDSFHTNRDVFDVIDTIIEALNGMKPTSKVKVEEAKPEPAPAPVAVEESEDGIEYRYKFSFSARLIRAGADRQDFYNEVKNEFLSYKKVTSKVSWEHELFKLGRIKCGVMKVKGKTLCLYLPLDPEKYDQERLFFKDMRVEGKEVEFPMMLQVKSDRGVKYAKELIAEVMTLNEIPHNDNYEMADYRLPEMSIEEMLTSDPVLAKLIDGSPVPVAPKAKEEPAKEEPVVEPAPAVVEEEEDESSIEYKYKFSFAARLIRSGMDRQEFYNQIKNEFLSYKKVNSKISWEHELFKLGRIKCGVMKVKGKTLCIYLPLDPSKYDQERLHFQDLRVEGKEVEFPMMMKVKSDRAVKYVKELIADVMKNNEIAHLDDYAPTDYKLKEMSIEQMLNAEPPLAKLIEGASMPVKEAKPAPKAKVEEEKPEPVAVEAPEEDENGIEYKYKFSFSARLIRAGAERQDFYNELKNEFLSYKKVNSKVSWEHELFKLGRIKCGVMKVKGKTLCVYLPLDPSKYDQERLHFQDLRVEGKEVEFPMMMKVKSDRAVKYVKELIADVMKNNEIAKTEDYIVANYRLPEMSIEEMLAAEPALAKLTDSDSVPMKAKEEAAPKAKAAPKAEKAPKEPAPEAPKAVVVEEKQLDKDSIREFLTASFKEKVLVTKKANYTSTDLPLGDTHYKVFGKNKKSCFLYVYELRDGKKYMIVKSSPEVMKKFLDAHKNIVQSKFPHTNDGATWYHVDLDASLKNAEIFEIIEAAFNSIESK